MCRLFSSRRAPSTFFCLHKFSDNVMLVFSKAQSKDTPCSSVMQLEQWFASQMSHLRVTAAEFFHAVCVSCDFVSTSADILDDL